jgi:cell envelope-related function transcriptional attenuator common domain
MKEFCQKHLKKFVYFLQIISSIVLIGAVYIIGMIPMNYIVIAAIVLLGLLIGEYFLIFYNKEKSKRSLITQIFSVLLSCLFVICSFYVYKVGRTVDMMAQGGFQTRAISVIVLKDSQIKNETQLHDHQIGYMPLIDTQSMQYAIEDIHKNVGQITTKEYEDPASLVNSLYQKDVDAIILDEAFRSIVEQDNPSFSDDTRVIYQVMRDEESVASKSVEVTEKPFLVYISGIDEYGDLSTVSRSDVNMLVAVNPNTKQILLISIPRDTYCPLHMNGQYDKFTHSGLYGLDESIATLQDIIQEDINYYGRMNFTSFIDIVDALGGVTVNSPQAFVTKIGKYEIKEGKNDLNAKQALAFVRERKSFADGDFARGRNQQRMISAIVKKICSPAIITSFSPVMDTISKSVETNFSSKELNALIKMQLSQMPSWDIQSCQITGEPATLPCYSLGNKTASVVMISDESVQEARQYIDQLLAGQKIQTQTGDLNQ